MWKTGGEAKSDMSPRPPEKWSRGDFSAVILVTVSATFSLDLESFQGQGVSSVR